MEDACLIDGVTPGDAIPNSGFSGRKPCSLSMRPYSSLRSRS